MFKIRWCLFETEIHKSRTYILEFTSSIKIILLLYFMNIKRERKRKRGRMRSNVVNSFFNYFCNSFKLDTMSDFILQKMSNA